MLNNLTSLILTGLTLQEKTKWGVNGLIIGLGTVFSILVVLIFVIFLLKVTAGRSKKPKSLKSIDAVVGPIEEAYDDDENEVIAAIAAAISCMASREGKKFAIKSFKRVGSRTKRSY